MEQREGGYHISTQLMVYLLYNCKSLPVFITHLMMFPNPWILPSLGNCYTSETCYGSGIGNHEFIFIVLRLYTSGLAVLCT